MTAGRVLVGAAAAIGALALGGCREKLDVPKVESTIKADLQRTHPDIKTVDCPDDLDAHKGETATCTVETTDGRVGKGTLSILGDDGRYTFTLR